MAGVSRLQYTTEARVIRVMCTGRVDLDFILRSFRNGADGVFIGGCHLGECNYITHGNYNALNTVLVCQKIMEHLDLEPGRLKVKFMSSGEGIQFADYVDEFIQEVKGLGPLGVAEEMDPAELKSKLEAVSRLVPYIKMVMRERLKIPRLSEEECREHFASEEMTALFNELILDKLAVSQITSLLREKPRSTGEIAEFLGLNPSEVSRHINSSTNQGLVRYDEGRKRYALA